MKSRDEQVVSTKLQILFGAALMLVQFFYLWKVIKPELYFTAQEPVFYLEKYFFLSFLNYPAGIVDYFSALLTHLQYVPWLGALFVSLINLTILLFFRGYLIKTTSRDPQFWYALPLLPLMLMQNFYSHSFALNLILFCALGAAVIHVHIRSFGTRLVFVVLAGGLIYYLAGISLLIYSGLAILFELIKNRKGLLPVVLLAVSLLYPYLAGSQLFAVSLVQAFGHPLPAIKNEPFHPFFLPGFFLFVLLLVLLITRVDKKSLLLRPPILGVQFLTILALIVIVPFIRSKRIEKQFWQFEYYARMQEWQKVLDLTKKPFLRNQQVLFQINRALGHTGHLADRLFFYQQPFGRDALFLPHDYGTVSPLVHSDLYFDLGHFNEAKRWAHEAASVRGESVWNVQRLALTYLIYDHRQAAELYFRKLEKTLFHKKWALRFRPFWSGQKPIASDSYLSSLIKSRVDHDALTFNDYPEKDLQILLAQNPENQFARDYMLADLLM
ncbi:MAG: hypothetical protein EHM72_16390, partial [Calditrichaeota bacterium]